MGGEVGSSLTGPQTGSVRVARCDTWNSRDAQDSLGERVQFQ